jgi:hypothetical protein
MQVQYALVRFGVVMRWLADRSVLALREVFGKALTMCFEEEE